MPLLLFPLLLLLLAGSLGPGLVLTRRLRWSPPERLAAAVGLSVVILYLAAGLIYATDAPRSVNLIWSVLSLAMLAASWRDLRGLLGQSDCGRMLGGYALLFAWALLLLAMIRNYSGALWTLDWVEHYQRTRFFLEHQPKDTLFLGVYQLPARPPLQNLIAAHFLAQVGDRFEFFQVILAGFNLLLWFPAWLLVRHFAGRVTIRTAGTALLCLLAASPLVLQNATYAWTKGLANFQVLLGLALYVRGWRKADGTRLLAAFLSLTSGVLVHYSAGPYLVLVLLHYLVAVWRRRPGRGRELVTIGLACALLASTWIGWSIAHYGTATTFGSNTTVTGGEAMSVADNLHKVARNLVTTLVPHPLRVGWDEFRATFFQPNPWGLVRDYAFNILQSNLVLGIGSLGGLIVLWLLARRSWPRSPGSAPELRFWLFLVTVGAVFSIATNPAVDPYGVAHVCSQPLVLLGLVFLAARLSALPRWCRVLAAVGVAVDFLLGIFLHFSLEHWQLGTTTVGTTRIMSLDAGMLNVTAIGNLVGKETLAAAFWGDHFAGHLPWLQAAALVGFALLFLGLLRVTLGQAGKARTPGTLAWAAVALPLAVGGLYLVMSPSWAARGFVPEPGDPAAVLAAARRNPDSADAKHHLALSQYLDGQKAAARSLWIEAWLLDPGHALARYFAQSIDAYEGLGTSPAERVAERLRVQPDSAAAQFEAAQLLLRINHPAPARRRLEEALRLQPDFPEAEAALRQLTAASP
jgi:hypothetical protein